MGYICEGSFLSAFPWTRFPLFLFPFSFFDIDACFSPVTVQQRRSGLLSLCPSGNVRESRFLFFILFFFFTMLSPLPPPLGKSSASSNINLVFGRGSFEVGTGLLGFHGFTLPVLSRCLYLLCLFVLGAAAPKSWLSLKKIWLDLGLGLWLWLLGLW